MYLRTALLGGLSLASTAMGFNAGALHDTGLRILGGRGESFEAHLRRQANGMISHVERRQAPPQIPGLPVPSLVPASGDAADFDFARWEAETDQPCKDSIAALEGQASNPTGMAVCYNAAFVDDRVFVAGLRLFNVSAPRDAWANLALTDMSLVMSYVSATVSLHNSTRLNRRDGFPSLPGLKERAVVTRLSASGLGARQADQTRELALLTYFGELNQGFNRLGPEAQQFLIPNITLTATVPQTNEQLAADLTAPNASFARGIFSMQSVNATSTADLQASASAAIEAAQPFIVPGVSFGITPIGFIITMVWTVLFVAVVGAGTFGRYQFREQYRRRIKREAALAFNNI